MFLEMINETGMLDYNYVYDNKLCMMNLCRLQMIRIVESMKLGQLNMALKLYY